MSKDTMLSDPKYVVDYNDVKTLSSSKEALIIDVREPKELKESGCIPGSINIPLKDVKAALETLSESEFESKYGVAKPNYDANVVFSCRSGRRAGNALETALQLGYKRVRYYPGSWLDWEKHAGGK